MTGQDREAPARVGRLLEYVMLYHCFNWNCDIIIGAKTEQELFHKIDEHTDPFRLFIRPIRGKHISIMLSREVIELDDDVGRIYGYSNPEIGELMYDAMTPDGTGVRVFEVGHGHGDYKLVNPNKRKFLPRNEEI